MSQDAAGVAPELPAPGYRPAPGSAEIRLLRARPTEVQAAERLAAVLSPEERQRADAFRRPADRSLYLVAHVGLRVLLGAYLGLPPAEVELLRAPCPLCGHPHGRPEVAAEPGLHFSLSHAGDAVLCGVAAGAVGVDVELAAAVPGTELLSVLHPSERNAVVKLPEHLQAEAFLHCWVRKEAYLKGIGTGLGTDPATVEVGLGPVYGDGLVPALGGWSLAAVPAPPGYAAAVALLYPGSTPVVTVLPLSLAALDATSGLF